MPDKTTFRVIELSKLNEEQTSHGGTLKSVFLHNEEMRNSLTQIALSALKQGESIPRHNHPTMDEYFFILSGEGIYKFEGTEVILRPNMLIEISANTEHELISTGENELRFLYWGVATE